MSRNGSSKRRRAQRAALRLVEPAPRPAHAALNAYAELRARGCYFDPIRARGWVCAGDGSVAATIAGPVTRLDPCEHVQAAIPNWRELVGSAP